MEAALTDQEVPENAEKPQVSAARFACAILRFRPNIRPETGRVKGPRSGDLLGGI
jgi:hypothetical protein